MAQKTINKVSTTREIVDKGILSLIPRFHNNNNNNNRSCTQNECKYTRNHEKSNLQSFNKNKN